MLLDALLAGDHHALAALEAKLEGATVDGRELSGVGFFTHLRPWLGAAAPGAPLGHSGRRDHAPDLEHGGAALRFVVDGVMTMLEAFSYALKAWQKGEVGST